MSIQTKRPGVARHSGHPAENQTLRGDSCRNHKPVPTTNHCRSVAEILPRVLARIVTWQRHRRDR
jgi:hypothetical protein